VVLAGDLELARVELDLGVSVPRGALDSLLRERPPASESDELDFRVRFAAAAALQLGWVALEEFVVTLAEIDAADRDEVRRQVRRLVASLLGRD
jgi:hypothetical protein